MRLKTLDDDGAECPAEQISVVIPAHNEADYIGACLKAMLAQDDDTGPVDVIVVANGCRDGTAAIARAHLTAFSARGWQLRVLDLPQSSKPEALNAGDAIADGTLRLYLDADVCCHPALLGQLRAALAVPEPRYATGTLEITRPRSRITKHYGGFWRLLPFVQGGAVGTGCYAVNSAGRARWAEFPSLIADDSFARLQFSPGERVEVAAPYCWPLTEGFSALVRVRRRQDAGMRELFACHPELAAREDKPRLGAAGILRLLFAAPVGFLVYAAVGIAVRARSHGRDWSRGR